MATGGNTRDVDLAIGVTTTGVDGVQALRKQVLSLADSGTEATPEFQKLAAELDKIAAQKAAVDTFTELRRAAANTAIELQKAAVEVDRLGAELPGAREAAAEWADAQKAAADAVKSTKDAIEGARKQLADLREEYPRGTRNVDEYKTAAKALQTQIDTLRATLRGQKDDLKATAQTAKEFAAADREVAGSYNQILNAARGLSASLGEQNRGLADARDALRSVGLESTNLVAAQRDISAAFDRTRAAIEAEVASVATGREREAAATRQYAEAQALLNSSFDFERTARIVAIEASIAESRTELTDKSRALAATEKELDAARKAGDLGTAATLEKSLAAARSEIELSTRKLTAAQTAFSTEIRTTLGAVESLEQVESRRADQINATTAAIEASRGRTAQQTAAENELRDARLAVETATIAETKAQNALDLALADRRPVSQEERALAEARDAARIATDQLVTSEARLRAQIEGGLAAQRQQVDIERQQEQISTVAIVRTQAEIDAETRLTAAHDAARTAALALASANDQLATARKIGDVKLIEDRERALAEARKQLTATSQAAIDAQQGLADAFREAAAAEGQSADATRLLADAQSLLAARFVVENIERQAAVETELAATREKLERSTRQLADANSLLDAENQINDAIRIEAAERSVAEARSRSEQVARELAAANTLLSNSVDLSKSTAEIAFEREIAAIRERVNVETRNLATAERLLAAERDLGGTDRVSEAERTTADVRAKLEQATRELAAAERVLVSNVRATIPVTTAAMIADRDRAAQALKTSAAIREAGNAARKALDDAFSATGVRSAQAIQEELLAIDQALLRIATDARATGNDFDRAFAGSRARVAALKDELAGIERVNGPLVGATRNTNLLSDALRQATVYFSAFTIGKEFFTANTQLETLRRTLTLVTGDTAIAAKSIEFLRKSAEDSGVAVSSISNAYSKFAASAVAAGIDLETVNKTFGSVTKAAGLLGLSSEETGGALNALGQIASKGKVSMEELSQQLGDRLPAVLATTAKGLGLTTAELTDLIQKGQLLGDKTFFQAFSKGIDETFIKGTGKVEGLNAAFAALKNTINDVFTRFGDAGAVSGMTTIFSGLGSVIKTLGDVAIVTGKGIGTMSAATVDLAVNVAKLDFTKARNSANLFNDAMKDIAIEAKKANPFGGFFDIFNIGADTAIDKVRSVEEAQKRLVELKGDLGIVDSLKTSIGLTSDVAAAIAKLEAGLARLAEMDRVASGASNEAAQAANDLGKGISAASLAAGDASSNYAKLVVDYNKIIKTANETGDALVKQAQAAKVAGDAATTLAILSGNETTARNQAAASAQAYGNALQQLADQRTLEADLIRAEIDAIEADAAATRSMTAAKQDAVDKLKEKLQASEAEALKTREAAAAQMVERDARMLLRATYGDQSKDLKLLTDSVQFYLEKQALLNAEMARGKDVTAEMAENTRQLTIAQALQKDALNDTTKALQIKNDQEKNNSNLKLGALEITRSQLTAELDILHSYGRTTEALGVQIRLKETEIAIIRAKVAAMITEANGAILVAKATEAQLVASGSLDPVKKQEIANSIANAEAKILEAKALGASVASLERQIELLRVGTPKLREHGAAGRETSGHIRDYGHANDEAASFVDRLTSRTTENIATMKAQAAAAIRAAKDLRALGDIGTQFLNSQQKALADKQAAGTLGTDDLAAARQNLEIAKANARAITSVSGAGLQAAQAAAKMVNEAQAIFDRANASANTFGAKTATFGKAPTVPEPAPAPKPVATTSAGVSLFAPKTTETATKNLELQRASLEVEKAQINAELELAQAQGDVVDATNFAIQAKQTEIKLLQNSIALTNQQADATIAAAQAKITELVKANELTAEKNTDLQNQIASARAQKIETGVIKVQIDKLEAEIRDLKGATSIESALEKFGLESQAALQQKADALSDAYEQVMESADLSIADQRTAFEQWAAAMIAANKGVENALVASERAALAAKEALVVPKAPTFTPTAAPAPYFSGGGTAGTAGKVAAPISPAPPPLTPAPAPVTVTPYATVNITLNGQPTAVTLATSSDAERLVSFLNGLTEAARSAGVSVSA